MTILKIILSIGALVVVPGFCTSQLDAFLSGLGINPTSISASDRAANISTLACAILGQRSPSETVTVSNATEYVPQSDAHWSATAWEYPQCIYNAGSTQDVAFAVKVLGYTKAQYAVRSGGHSPLTGWANIENGVLLSLSGVTDISYDANAQTIRAGFGLRWLDVYQYAEQFGRLVVGGRITDVGQALTLGGGLSHLSNAHGFSADNVKSFEVVLADGSVVNASSSAHQDLYWALKGGSNNFGIVTHMVMSTYPCGKVWGGEVIYDVTQTDALMAAFASYQASGQNDTNSAIITDMVTTVSSLIFTFVYLKPVVRPPCFNAFYEIPHLVDNTQIYNNYTALVGGPLVTGTPRWTWGTTTIYLDNQTYVDVANLAIQQATVSLASVVGGLLVIFPQPISTSMVTAAASRGGNPLGLVARPQLWYTINIGWQLAADDQVVYAALADILQKTVALTKSRNLWNPFTFMNDAFSSQGVIANYGAANQAALQHTARKYDPNGMFQTQVPGGFKVF